MTLLTVGADPPARTKSGLGTWWSNMTALDVAQHQGHAAVAVLLRDAAEQWAQAQAQQVVAAKSQAEHKRKQAEKGEEAAAAARAAAARQAEEDRAAAR
eukprot:COSAG02_NODE_52013_length_310_cov_1.199052_1_plen_98_part_10